MTSLRRRVQRDEQGVALVLALAFTVLVGLVTSALLSSLASAVNERSTLDTVRDRQYAADGAVQQAIATVRGVGAPGPGLAACGGPYTRALNGITIRVDCTNVPTLTRTGYVQRNVVFTSCVSTGVACTTATTIVRAQVNYEANDAETPTVTRTWIQSWTVTR
jgi:hypothetical protein